MTILFPLVVLGLGLCQPGTASPLDKQDQQRVRAETATVMTVEGNSTKVEAQETPSRPGLTKKKRRFAFAPLKAWTSLVDVTGKMMYIDQDVPSRRERDVRQEVDN